MASLCTARAIKEYFLEGKLPVNGLVCPTDEELFSTAMSDEGAFWLTESQNYPEDDLKLLDTVRGLGEAIYPSVSTLL